MNRKIRYVMYIAFLCIVGLSSSTHAQTQLDFIQLYERGKLLLRQKLYTDALKEFKRASYTGKGQKHFGVHFYMAIAHFRLASISNASRLLKKAKLLAVKARHKAAAQRLQKKIYSLYGSFQITPEVDPDEVGRLKLKLVPTTPFSNKLKVRFFKRFQKKVLAPGIPPNNSIVYLPKGEYKLNIQQPQCLKYKLARSGTITKELSIDGPTVRLQLQAGASCRCIGGQKLYRVGRKMHCACPSGLGWNTQKQRCETAYNPVPLIIGLSVGILAAGGAVIGISAAIANANRGNAGQLQSQTPNQPGIWK